MTKAEYHKKLREEIVAKKLALETEARDLSERAYENCKCQDYAEAESYSTGLTEVLRDLATVNEELVAHDGKQPEEEPNPLQSTVERLGAQLDSLTDLLCSGGSVKHGEGVYEDSRYTEIFETAKKMKAERVEHEQLKLRLARLLDPVK